MSTDGRATGTVESRSAERSLAEGADAEVDAADDAEAATAAPSEPLTIELVVSSPDGVAQFERMLARHQITMSAEDLSAEQAAAWGASRDLMERYAKQEPATDAAAVPNRPT